MEKKFFKKVVEKIIEGVLMLSSSITSITVLLIIVFLFREGFGLFNQPPVEHGMVLAVNKTNPVTNLSAEQIKGIFDQEITNWKDVGGRNDSIILFTIDDIEKYFTEEQLGDTLQFIPQRVSQLIDSIPGMIAFLQEKNTSGNFNGKILAMED